MGLPDAVARLVKAELRKTWTTALARIDTVNYANSTCNITLMNEVFGRTITLRDVPVAFMYSGKTGIFHTLKIGQIVSVMFLKSNPMYTLQTNEISGSSKNPFDTNNGVIIQSLPLIEERGKLLYIDELLEIPEEGLRIVSDENVRIQAPCVDVPSPILQGSEEAEDATTSGSYVQSWRYNFVTGPWKYVIHWFFEVTNSSGGQDINARIQIDDITDITEVRVEPAAGDAWIGQSGVYFLDLTSEGVGPNSHYIDVDFARPAGGTSKIRRKRIVIYKVIENVGCPIP